MFTRTGSARAVVKAFAAQGLSFPRDTSPAREPASSTGNRWATTTCSDTLHNPRYAGAYCYGRKRHLAAPNGTVRTITKPREEWTVLLPDAHPGYITFTQFEANQATLAANAAAHGDDRKAGPAREGPALLQGLVVCGKCGKRMTVRYHKRCNGTLVPRLRLPGVKGGITTGTPRSAKTSAAQASTPAVSPS